jgi:hypothetical protein
LALQTILAVCGPRAPRVYYHSYMAKALFYLPVVTPWWFDNNVAPLIKSLATEAEVHILVPPLWRNTGIAPEQLKGLDSTPGLHWHIVEGDSHASLRTHPADPDGLVQFVNSIGPDYVLCRSADVATPARFPGTVVHLLEAGATPFVSPPASIILQRDFWHHGHMPALSEEDRAVLDAAFAKTWRQMHNRFESKSPFRLSRERALKQMGLPTDRTVIALPLEYEHEEAFTQFHNRFERNIDLVQHIAGALDDSFVLALTDHPLNHKHVDNRSLHSAIHALGPKAHLVPNPHAANWPTTLLIKHCDGLVVQNTKAIYAAAFFGKPTLRLSNRPTAPWLGVHHDIPAFLRDAAGGTGGAPADQARLWFAYHIMHEVISPSRISGAELLDRLDRPFSRDRIQRGLERFEAHQPHVDWLA